MRKRKYEPRISDVLGVALCLLMPLQLGFAALTARLDLSVLSLFVRFLLQLPVYLIPVFFVFFAYKRLGRTLAVLPRTLDYNRTAMLTVSTFGAVVILQVLYAAVFPSTVPISGVARDTSVFAFLLLSLTSVVLPCVLEEMLFRGVVLRALTAYRALLAILISSLVNALTCFSLEAFPIRFVCSFLIGSLYYATGSLAVSVSVRVLAGSAWFLAEAVSVYAVSRYDLFVRVLVAACALLLAFGLPFLKATVRALLADENDAGVLPSSHFWGIPISVFLILAVGVQIVFGAW
ncbi:MAG: CPBP family intramembrane metalloprotease [Clostridia bacterium]|nr:CPBP family intramembrane metalloprotease [Clostridia bacterium]